MEIAVVSKTFHTDILEHTVFDFYLHYRLVTSYAHIYYILSWWGDVRNNICIWFQSFKCVM